MAYKMKGSKFYGKSNQSPVKQMTDFSNITIDGEDANTAKKRNIKEREKEKKRKEKEAQDLLNKPDQSINRDKFRKEDMKPSRSKKKKK
tara:strand:- start:205 stop:471 length:267 start_codon:yes stop_codon:yes gene_type:complete